MTDLSRTNLRSPGRISIHIKSLIPRRMSGPENECAIFSNQNVPVKRINTARFGMILVSIDSSYSQLSIDTKIITNRSISRRFMGSFRFHLICHLFSRPLILRGNRTHDNERQKYSVQNLLSMVESVRSVRGDGPSRPASGDAGGICGVGSI